MTLTEIIAGRIYSLCKAKGIGINKLASMSGVPQSTLNSIMHLKMKSPKLSTLMQVANGLNMTIVEFLDIPEIEFFSFDEPSSSERTDP